tara:strand:+ start:3684 stop:3998 length:315 start_codon:yes stop_codon:yes gene_type:complete
MLKKNLNPNSKKTSIASITVRVSRNQYTQIINEAEELKMNNSEFYRYLWESYNERKSLMIEINRLEKRLERRIFEIVSAVAELNEQEYLKAKHTYLSKIKKGNK